MRVRPGLTLLLYLLLVASAAVSLGVQRGAVGASEEARRSAPWVFLAFAVGFGAYRLALASVKKYSAGKAFFQVGVTSLFCMLLFLSSAEGEGTGAARGDLESALTAQSATTRALAAELMRHRPDAQRYGKALVKVLGDGDAEVREAAHQSLVSLNQGVDLGPAQDAEARKRWAEKFP